MKRIRAGSGLGDSIYLRPIAEHFARSGPLRVLSNYPDVFRDSGAEVIPFERVRGDAIIAHYSGGKNNPNTTQYQDMLDSAGVRIPLPLRFSWKPTNYELIGALRQKAGGWPLVLVHGGRAPMGRIDGYGGELMPAREAFNTALKAIERDCYLVRVGKAAPLYPLDVHEDLNQRTSISDLLDLAWCCDGIIAQCSFAVPLAECFDKPLLAIWAAKGLASRDKWIAQVTPRKILTGARSSFAQDNWTAVQIGEAAHAFRFVG